MEESRDLSISTSPGLGLPVCFAELGFLLVCTAFDTGIETRVLTLAEQALYQPSCLSSLIPTPRVTLKSDFPSYCTFHSTFSSGDERPILSSLGGSFLSRKM